MRFIDADEFIEDLKTEALNLAMDGMKGTPRPRQHLYEMIDRIEEQPTAYDVDKVVAELEKASWEETDISTVVYIDDAIKIIKAGGVNGQS